MSSEVIIVPSLFLVIGYVFYVMANAFTRRQQLRSTTEFQTKLLERMGTIAKGLVPGGLVPLSALGGSGAAAAASRRTRATAAETAPPN